MNIIEQAADLLRPFMGEDRRDTWLTLAFHAEHPDVYHAIPQRGATADFVVACVRSLLDHGYAGRVMHSRFSSRRSAALRETKSKLRSGR